VGPPEGKRALGRPRLRWVDDIKLDLREIGWGGMGWIDVAQDRDKWVHQTAGKWQPVEESFSRGSVVLQVSPPTAAQERTPRRVSNLSRGLHPSCSPSCRFLPPHSLRSPARVMMSGTVHADLCEGT
jgi:hypothetical protein